MQASDTPLGPQLKIVIFLGIRAKGREFAQPAADRFRIRNPSAKFRQENSCWRFGRPLSIADCHLYDRLIVVQSITRHGAERNELNTCDHEVAC